MTPTEQTLHDYVKANRPDLIDAWDNVYTQRNDALARIATSDADKAKALADAATAAATDKAKALADAKTASDADKAKALADAATAAATDKAAAIAAATDPLHAQITTLTTSLASANATITTLQQQVAALQIQLAGQKGSYKITTTTIQEAALAVEAASTQSTPTAILLGSAASTLYAIATKHEQQIFGAALAMFPTLPQVNQLAILTILGLKDYAVLQQTAPATFADFLAKNALPAFTALPTSLKERVVEIVGIGGTPPAVFIRTTAPDDTVGANGDIWINTADGQIYQKTNGTYF